MSEVETLLDLADHLLAVKDRLVVIDGTESGDADVAALAIKFKQRGAGFVFKALSSRWSLKKLYREMY